MHEIKYTMRNLVSTNSGNLPILLTCSHNGNTSPNAVPERDGSNLHPDCHRNFNKLADSFTLDITVGVANNIFRLTKREPYVVIANYHRKYIDANRPRQCAYKVQQAKKYYDTYHRTIARFIRKICEQNTDSNGLGFLFDIHGTVGISKYKADVIIGTNNGKSISSLLKINRDAMWDDKGLIELLKKQGYKTSPQEKDQREIAKFNGGYTVTTYGSTRDNKGLQAIQFEIAPSIRKNKDKREIFKTNLARSIVRFVSQYDYIWPLSGSIKPDKMNTSFGPRIKNDRWHFHEGIDLPASEGTKVYAMHSGEIYRAGAHDEKFKSRHVVIKVKHNLTNTRPLYLVYLHLSKISKNIKSGVKVKRGQNIGKVGSDGATYPHLHIEFRKGKLYRGTSVHPLNYLPYDQTTNFTAPVADRFQKCGPNTIKARLFFQCNDKNEGDLKKVEVSLFENSNSIINSPEVVDFDNGRTIHKNDANNDQLIYNNQGIGVEGYQKSNMVSQGYSDLYYGILIRDIPENCNKLSAKIIDVRGNAVISPDITISQKSIIDQSLDFEDGLMPPKHWRIVTNETEIGKNNHQPNRRERMQVSNVSVAAYNGNRGMLSQVSRFSGSGAHAAIEYKFPNNDYFELLVEVMFNPLKLNLDKGKSIYPLYFLDNEKNFLSIAAGIYKRRNNTLQTRLIAKNPDGSIKRSGDAGNANRVSAQEWRRWRLELRRIDTRETTAILSLGYEDNPASVEVAHISYDSRTYKPNKLRVGIGFCSSNAGGTIFADNIRLTSCI
jgi:murein DD-endopeptidase MepM/ murein hydrolase activator NlpD